MERELGSLRGVLRAAAMLVCSLATLGGTAPAARAATAEWLSSNLDLWTYPNGISVGARALAPSFLGGVSINESTQQFDPLSSGAPSRLGTALIAFNTALNVTPMLDPSRYKVNSVTFKATWTYDGDTHALQYRDTPVTQPEILAEALSGSFSSQMPLELYGVGLTPAYTGYEFSATTIGPPLYDEQTSPYETGSYNAYPIVGSTAQPGEYVDVSNSVTGGYSATEATHQTAPFTPTPWSIGKANLTAGASIPDKTTFTFSLDLDLPGVRSYVQQSLSDGGLGFAVSSLHSTGEFGAGGGYPRWYMKEAAGFPYFIPANRVPQLVIDYEILPAGVPGDYNGNNVVDAADYVLWRNGGPLANQVDDPSQVNAADYTEWRSRFGNFAGSGAGSVVPEPGLGSLSMIALECCLTARLRRRGCR
jgi:hypothetical protein